MGEILSFNRIVILRGSSNEEVTIEGFFRLPLSERVRYILGKQLQFFFGNQPIESKLAFAELRTYYKTT